MLQQHTFFSSIARLVLIHSILNSHALGRRRGTKANLLFTQTTAVLSRVIHPLSIPTVLASPCCFIVVTHLGS